MLMTRRGEGSQFLFFSFILLFFGSRFHFLFFVGLFRPRSCFGCSLVVSFPPKALVVKLIKRFLNTV